VVINWYVVNEMLLIFTGKGRNNRTAIIIVVPIVFLMLLILSICIYLRKRKPKDNFESKLNLVHILYAFTWSKPKTSFRGNNYLKILAFGF
jgi:hypothetical protein